MHTQTGMRYFLPVWLGQLFSTLGTSLCEFALSLWLYEQTHSPTLFALGLLSAVLPTLVLSPVAGVLVDRWDRRRIMILADFGAAVCTLLLAGGLAFNQVTIWHVYGFNVVTASLNAFQQPAYQAAITLLVPPAQYGRASGMVQLGDALANIIAPALAGALVVGIGVSGVLLIDVLTATLAIGLLLVVRIPNPERAAAAHSDDSWGAAVTFGWRYIQARPGLMGLLLIFAMVNLFLGFFSSLVMPMLLTLTTPDRAGIVISISGVGMLVGSLVLSAWGGPQRRIHGVLGGLMVIGLGYALTGISASLVMISIGAFGLSVLIPLASGSGQVIFQKKVAPEIQGRVFATRRMIAMGAIPIAYLMAGPLAERVFDPLLAVDGPLAGSLGLVLGVGPGRGIGLMFVIMGLSCMGVTLIGYLNPRIRRVEDELPDAVAVPAAEAESGSLPATIPLSEGAQ